MPETAMAGPSPDHTPGGRLGGPENNGGGMAMATQQEFEDVKARQLPHLTDYHTSKKAARFDAHPLRAAG